MLDDVVYVVYIMWNYTTYTYVPTFVLYVCSFSCKNLIDLRKHLETHSSEPAYHCDFVDCDYSTRSLHSIKNHYKRVHEVSQSDNYSSIC